MAEDRKALIDFPLGPARRTAHEVVRDVLRASIIRGALPAGTRLVQADIAAALGVSTTPVREALRDLATEGSIQLDAHRGAVVSSLNPDELLEIYDLRRLLEPVAYRRAAASITDEELAVAERLHERMQAEQDHTAWAELNARFHGILMDACRSPRLVSILVRLRANASPYVALLLKLPSTELERPNDQHREMLDALRIGDGERAGQIAVEHLQATMQSLIDTSIARSRRAERCSDRVVGRSRHEATDARNA